jgi:ER membrane protein complex subunit 3
VKDCLILAAESNQMMPQMGMNPTAGMQQNPLGAQDPDKLFRAEAENLELVQHEWILEGVEERLLTAKY